MAGLVSDLINVLNEQHGYYVKLLEFSQEKKEVLIKNDIESLQKITSAENIIVGKSQRLERSRVGLMHDIANVLNQNPKNLTVTLLAQLIEGQDGHGELIKIAEELRLTLESLKEVNDLNKSLVKSSLDYIEYSMNVMHSSMESAPATYDGRGEEIGHNRAFFDAKQ